MSPCEGTPHLMGKRRSTSFCNQNDNGFQLKDNPTGTLSTRTLATLTWLKTASLKNYPPCIIMSVTPNLDLFVVGLWQKTLPGTKMKPCETGPLALSTWSRTHHPWTSTGFFQNLFEAALKTYQQQQIGPTEGQIARYYVILKGDSPTKEYVDSSFWEKHRV